MLNFVKKGFLDYIQSFCYPSKWVYLALMDVYMRYKRTILGPWWITLSIGIIILVMSLVWPNILSVDMNFFLPYFTIGYIYWHWIQSTLVESCSVFIEFEGLIKQVKLPVTTLVLRVTTRNLILFLHNSILIIIVLYFYIDDANYLFIFFNSIYSVFLVFVSLSAIGVMLAFLSVRYRDIINIIGYFLQLLFFITPIIWHASIINKIHFFLEFNIVFHWIEIFRQPLIKLDPFVYSYYVVEVFALIMIILSLYFIGKNKNNLPFWL